MKEQGTMSEHQPTPFKFDKAGVNQILQMAKQMAASDPDIDAENFAADVLVKCYMAYFSHEESATPLANPEGYFYRIAKYMWIDLIKKKMQQREQMGVIGSLDTMGEREWDKEETQLKSDFLYWVDRDDLRNRLQVMLAKATPVKRAVWRLYLQDQSHAEIARRLGISEGMSRQYIHRGKMKIKEEADAE
jgi:RNA polymerase sigma factor (sigma-70 family)